MDKSRDSSSDCCPNCIVYRSRIKDLEKIDKDHRNLNIKLRREIGNIYFLIGNLDEKEGYEYR